ncbi:MAG: molybdopterin converting factor subunit 1 [Casimicrobiaceae bacterium]
MPDSTPTAIAAVTVQVVYLARLREAFGRSGETLAIAGEAPTVNTVLAALRARDGEWARELAVGRAVRVAVNHELVAADARLTEGDEVALLPPVTGG